MQKIEITHIGSLPFLDIEDAIDYTFKFDIPVLFTLPILHPNEFMGQDILNQLKIPFRMVDHKIYLEESSLVTSSELIPPHYDRFINECVKRNRDEFKYQLIGPFTFYKMMTSSSNIAFKDAWNFLFDKYLHLFDLFDSYKIIFFIDEPSIFLASTEELSLIKSFMDRLSVHKNIKNIGIHFCSKLHPRHFELFSPYIINFDISQYISTELSEVKGFNSCGISAPYTNVQDNLGIIKSKTKDRLYFTPSCGLAFDSSSSLEHIFNHLVNLKKLFLLDNPDGL